MNSTACCMTRFSLSTLLIWGITCWRDCALPLTFWDGSCCVLRAFLPVGNLPSASWHWLLAHLCPALWLLSISVGNFAFGLLTQHKTVTCVPASESQLAHQDSPTVMSKPPAPGAASQLTGRASLHQYFLPRPPHSSPSLSFLPQCPFSPPFITVLQCMKAMKLWEMEEKMAEPRFW